MFSSTVSSDSAFVSWNVRTWPIRATLNDGTPASSVPSYAQWPVFGLSNPHSRLNSVVLPAPFGPIRAVMAPRGISRCSTSTAFRPPKRRVTPSITRIGSFLATPGAGSPTASPVVLGRWMPVVDVVGSIGADPEPDSLLDKGHLPLVAENALRAEDHQQH